MRELGERAFVARPAETADWILVDEEMAREAREHGWEVREFVAVEQYVRVCRARDAVGGMVAARPRRRRLWQRLREGVMDL